MVTGLMIMMAMVRTTIVRMSLALLVETLAAVVSWTIVGLKPWLGHRGASIFLVLFRLSMEGSMEWIVVLASGAGAVSAYRQLLLGLVVGLCGTGPNVSF